MPDVRRTDKDEPGDVEADLGALWDIVVERWMLLLSLIVIGSVLGYALSLVFPKKYEGRVVLATLSDEIGSGSNSGGLGDVSGLASLVGISVQGSQGQKPIALATLQSDLLMSRFIEAEGLLPILYSSQWDQAKKQWKDPKSPPTLWKATKKFGKSVLSVTDDKKTGMVYLSLKWSDPVLVANWANEYVKMANDELKSREIKDAEKNIYYLNQEADKTNAVEVRLGIYALLKVEIRKEMLAQGSDEYALRVIDPAVPPERPVSPIPLVWSLAGAVLGGAIALFIAIATKRR